MELLPDLLVRLAVGDRFEDALLLGREPGQLLVPHEVLALAQAVQYWFRDRGVQEAFSSTHSPDGPDELAALDLLEHVARGAGHDRGEERFVVGERCQHDDLGLGSPRSDLASRLDATSIR